MIVNGQHYRAIWMEGTTVRMINQNLLPFEFKVHDCCTLAATCEAITTMITRGAGSIGAAGAYGMLQAIYSCCNDDELATQLWTAKQQIDATRPTAVNLSYATQKVLLAAGDSRAAAIEAAKAVADECVESGRLIGIHGNSLILNGFGIETHCNAGWLALVDYGSALAPIYAAQAAGKDITVYVDETRPRNQGARQIGRAHV